MARLGARVARALVLLVAAGCAGDLFHSTAWSSRCDEGRGGACGQGGASSASAGHGGASSVTGSVGSSAASGAGAGATTTTASSGSGGATSSQSASASSSGSAIGCADGQREGFVDLATYPNIAACAGGWTTPGVLGNVAPSCGLQGGDDGPNPPGIGCAVSDLCAAGWHVCSSKGDVAAKSPSGCMGVAVPNAPAAFFVTAQSGSGAGLCDGNGANDLFGCGTIGIPPSATCAPLDRFSNDLCMALVAPWTCGTDNTAEAANVTKPGADAGGALCCRD